jgi:hypothetical protein
MRGVAGSRLLYVFIASSRSAVITREEKKGTAA